MNYIKGLQNEAKEQGARLVGLMALIQDLREYLSLPKFQDKGSDYVQVNDILLRIQEGLSRAEELVDDQIRINREV